MGTVSVSLPSDGSTADVADYNTPITAIVNEVNGNLDNANIKSSAAIDGSKIADSSIINDKFATAVKPVTLLDETTFDFVASGCVWSGDSYGSTLAASMTSGVVYINGIRVPVTAVTARAFTASKDTYIDVGTDGVVDYSESTNNAASQALAADHLRLGIIVSGAGNIAAVGSVNQGQENKVLPIASSIPYAVTDSLGNVICPRDASRRVLGYRQLLTDFTTTATPTVTDVTGLSMEVNVPTGRKVKISAYTDALYSTAAAGTNLSVYLRESTTTLQRANYNPGVTQYAVSVNASIILTPSAGVHTYKVSISQSAAGTVHYEATSTSPSFVVVELV